MKLRIFVFFRSHGDGKAQLFTQHIAQIETKSCGMSGDSAVSPGKPLIKYASQFTISYSDSIIVNVEEHTPVRFFPPVFKGYVFAPVFKTVVQPLIENKADPFAIGNYS